MCGLDSRRSQTVTRAVFGTEQQRQLCFSSPKPSNLQIFALSPNLLNIRHILMLHFPSSVNGIPRRSDSLHLNATQQKSSSHPIFLKVEEELHDARRVHSDGQEDDLRSALSMVINRVSELVRNPSNFMEHAHRYGFTVFVAQ